MYSEAIRNRQQGNWRNIAVTLIDPATGFLSAIRLIS
jgi:hypothetical protein